MEHTQFEVRDTKKAHNFVNPTFGGQSVHSQNCLFVDRKFRYFNQMTIRKEEKVYSYFYSTRSEEKYDSTLKTLNFFAIFISGYLKLKTRLCSV